MRIIKRHTLIKPANNYVIDAPTPSNISYWWNIGSLLGLSLVIQIITGVTLAMHYNANVLEAFNSVEHIMRDVNNGWLIRYLHANTASAFFFLVYLHIGRGIYYGSYKAPRTLTWTIGTIILILMMATAFLGYVLPYGQMSLWGATVITNLLSAIPWVGQDIVEFVWGGFSVNNATLNRFFSLHFVLPFILAALVLMHLIALHDSAGTNNPLGVSGNYDRIPFAPYFVFKDIITVFIFLFILSLFVFFMPNILGDSENYVMANPMQTPPAIVPEWYLLPFYAILRSIPNKLVGVICMFSAILIILYLTVGDISKLRGSQFKPFLKALFFFFIGNLLLLLVLGARHVESPFIEAGQIGTLIYFLYFGVIVPFNATFENSINEFYIGVKNVFFELRGKISTISTQESEAPTPFSGGKGLYSWIPFGPGEGPGVPPYIQINTITQYVGGFIPTVVTGTSPEEAENIFNWTARLIPVGNQGILALPRDASGQYDRTAWWVCSSYVSNAALEWVNRGGPDGPSGPSVNTRRETRNRPQSNTGSGITRSFNQTIRNNIILRLAALVGTILGMGFFVYINIYNDSDIDSIFYSILFLQTNNVRNKFNSKTRISNKRYMNMQQPQGGEGERELKEIVRRKAGVTAPNPTTIKEDPSRTVEALRDCDELIRVDSAHNDGWMTIHKDNPRFGEKHLYIRDNSIDGDASIVLFRRVNQNMEEENARRKAASTRPNGVNGHGPYGANGGANGGPSNGATTNRLKFRNRILNFSKFVGVLLGLAIYLHLHGFNYADAPTPWGLYFQDTASPQMEALTELHDNIMFYLVAILFAVGWIIAAACVKFFTSGISNKFVSHGSLVEIIWTVSPGIILILIAFTSFKLLYLMDEVSDVNMTLYMEGHQWYWSYQYPDFLDEDGEFIEYDSYLTPESDLEPGSIRMLDVDERVIMPELTHARFIVSSGDVIHCYACPALGIKADAYPGRLNQASALINRLGTFYGQCSEICGILHSSMPIALESVTLEKFLLFLWEK